MKDFRDEPLSTGDKVVYIAGGYGGMIYLALGMVKRVTQKGATVVTNLEDEEEVEYGGFFVKSARLVKL